MYKVVTLASVKKNLNDARKILLDDEESIIRKKSI